jgi:hypothetical protein
VSAHARPPGARAGRDAGPPQGAPLRHATGPGLATGNAQETLARLLAYLKLPRYTLHGLRATGPVALKMLGFENRAIRTLTGHSSDRDLEIYLQGVEGYPLAKAAQEALAGAFGDLLEEVLASPEANARRFAGVMGRAAKRLERRPKRNHRSPELASSSCCSTSDSRSSTRDLTSSGRSAPPWSTMLSAACSIVRRC